MDQVNFIIVGLNLVTWVLAIGWLLNKMLNNDL